MQILTGNSGHVFQLLSGFEDWFLPKSYSTGLLGLHLLSPDQYSALDNEYTVSAIMPFFLYWNRKQDNAWPGRSYCGFHGQFYSAICWYRNFEQVLQGAIYDAPSLLSHLVPWRIGYCKFAHFRPFWPPNHQRQNLPQSTNFHPSLWIFRQYNPALPTHER